MRRVYSKIMQEIKGYRLLARTAESRQATDLELMAAQIEAQRRVSEGFTSGSLSEQKFWTRLAGDIKSKRLAPGGRADYSEPGQDAVDDVEKCR